MKITGTKSQLKVEIDEKTLIIQGELTSTPTFYADSNSIKKWEPPHENETINEQERIAIIKKILEENRDNQFKIIFE